MNRFDLTPLYRSTIGFDRLASLFDTVRAAEKGTAFPPYNLVSCFLKQDFYPF